MTDRSSANKTSADTSTVEAEISIEDCDEAQLLSVLCESLGDAVRDGLDSEWDGAPKFYRFAHAHVTFMENTPGFRSCTLRGELPWADSVEWARAMFPKLGKRIVCDPGAHYPEVHPLSDEFLLIDANGERIVHIEHIEGIDPS
jgi:hypothetical protein